ncbi:MAG: hypothetical protein US42_C0002G0051 [Candidatus Magasanikbacteria bacterium GW2011_GWC2_37_14]|uniref:DUF721 domain-containing protein n=1 Tax=Candidatus Magasanikbacteria bacterium GW2011_GWC2_37_14 TaxID=1619046 RepID=A0A0G0JJ69_9BACT|nr:MAG: hypothetical protein US42_C0002G0051 [Candidatus Magasanikbacteria bacterium GW2011_GWC2_37_14]
MKQLKNNASVNDELILLAETILAEVLGLENAIFVKPLFLKNRTLTVACTKVDLAPSIREKQQIIVEKINEKLGKNEVDRIRYLL